MNVLPHFLHHTLCVCCVQDMMPDSGREKVRAGHTECQFCPPGHPPCDPLSLVTITFRRSSAVCQVTSTWAAVPLRTQLTLWGAGPGVFQKSRGEASDPTRPGITLILPSVQQSAAPRAFKMLPATTQGLRSPLATPSRMLLLVLLSNTRRSGSVPALGRYSYQSPLHLDCRHQPLSAHLNLIASMRTHNLWADSRHCPLWLPTPAAILTPADSPTSAPTTRGFVSGSGR